MGWFCDQRLFWRCIGRIISDAQANEDLHIVREEQRATETRAKEVHQEEVGKARKDRVTSLFVCLQAKSIQIHVLEEVEWIYKILFENHCSMTWFILELNIQTPIVTSASLGFSPRQSFFFEAPLQFADSFIMLLWQ